MAAMPKYRQQRHEVKKKLRVRRPDSFTPGCKHICVYSANVQFFFGPGVYYAGYTSFWRTLIKTNQCRNHSQSSTSRKGQAFHADINCFCFCIWVCTWNLMSVQRLLAKAGSLLWHVSHSSFFGTVWRRMRCPSWRWTACRSASLHGLRTQVFFAGTQVDICNENIQQYRYVVTNAGP